MKSYFLALAVLLTAVTASVAQNYDPVKTLVMLNQFDKAKTDIDKAFNNPKYTAKPEAYILKAIVYSSLANTDGKKVRPKGSSWSLMRMLHLPSSERWTQRWPC